MRIELFEYRLPDALIAQAPVEPRDQSRLMVLPRDGGDASHRVFADLVELLRPGDVLVRNDTKVVPARLVGRRCATGGKWEGLFVRARPEGWEMLATTRGKPVAGETVEVGTNLVLTLVERLAGGWLVRPAPGSEDAVDVDPTSRAIKLLERHGTTPLPPYIRGGRESPGDRPRYQTVYARRPGAVAAPTAGLHFTDSLCARLVEVGVAFVDVTLHVGPGTFRPIEVDDIEAHALHAEWAELSADAADRLNAARDARGRIIAVGTTSARVLETAASADGRIAAFAGETATYIRPGHVFRGLDGLITNFHLPRSSLLVLVAALAGRDRIMQAYQAAVAMNYRFYSYGDAMIIL